MLRRMGAKFNAYKSDKRIRSLIPRYVMDCGCHMNGKRDLQSFGREIFNADDLVKLIWGFNNLLWSAKSFSRPGIVL